MTSNDTLRAWLNLLLAPLMWVTSSLGFFLPSATDAGEFSDRTVNLLVPPGPAFSIWFPIFVGVIGYGLYQFKPANRSRELYRATGWWTALGFALINGWALIVAFAPHALAQVGSAVIFVPAVAALIVATVRFTARVNQVSGLERLFTWVPVSLIAGWCSLAVFLNWTPIAYDVFADGRASVTSSLLILAAALGLIIWACRKALCNKVYIVPAVWGLSWLAARHLYLGMEAPIIGWAALGGIILLLGSALLHPRVPIAGYAQNSSA